MTDQANQTARQLLYGFLALQNDFVTREQLIAGFSTWLADKSQPLDSVLHAQGFLQEADQTVLRRLVDKHLQRHGDDPQASLTSFTNVADLAETMVRQVEDAADHDTEHTLVALETLKQQFDKISQPDQATDRTASARYRVVKMHARGGLGEVYLAHDSDLNREVALKEIQPRFADDPESQGRFLLEAEITGSLEHPGIVPVYGLGKYADGRPFYAMRFLHGATLKEMIEELFEQHQREHPRQSITRSMRWRKLLGHFITVCKTIEYAHSRGVIHRDIKPSNVMTGRFGEALVVDWGLAKVLGRSEDRRDNDETTLRPRSGEGSSATLDGVAIGTPAFMSPEQASGDLDSMGPPSDIYSLGASLYYLLTGKSRFGDEGLGSILDRIQKGRFPAPIELDPSVPKSLDAICRKAMALEPNGRYSSALALAEDLELWLADEPVSVYRGGRSERLGRWMRRNRGLVQSAAMALILVSVFSSLAAFLFLMLRNEANLQRHNALQAREAAVTAQQKAEQLADTNQQLAAQEELARRRAEKLAEENGKLAELEAAERQRAVDLAAKMSVEADKAKRLSEFLIRTFQASDPIGQGAAPGFLPKEKGGELTAREMLALGAERAVEDPDLIKFPLSQAAVMDAIGDAYRQLGMLELAQPLLSRALKIRREHLPADHPDLATSLHNMAWYYHERGNYPQAMLLYDEALAIRRNISGDEGQRLVSNTLHNKAWMLANEGWCDEAETLAREAYAIRRKVLGSQHRDTIFSHFALTFVLIEQAKFTEAAIQLGIVRANLSGLKADPEVSKAAFQFALGVINRDLIGLKASESNLRTALDACMQGLGEDNLYVAVIHCELGTTLQMMGELDEAREQFEASLKIARLRVDMEHPRIRILVGRYADLLSKQGEAELGKAVWDEFLTAQKNRFDAEYGQVLSATYNYGHFLKDANKYEDAEAAFAEVANTIVASRAKQTGYRYDIGLLGDALNQQGLCSLADARDLSAAVDFFRASVASLDEEIASQPDAESQLRELQGWPQINLAVALTRLGRNEEAEQALSESQSKIESVSRSKQKPLQEYMLDARIEFAKLRGAYEELPGYATSLLELRRSEQRDLVSLASTLCESLENMDADQPVRAEVTKLAIEAVRQAVANGYDIANLSTWKRLTILQSEAEYKQLLGDTPLDKKTPDADP